MAMSRSGVLCLMVLVAGLLVSASAETQEHHKAASKEAVKKNFLAWVSRHQERYTTYQAQSTFQTQGAAPKPTCYRTVGKPGSGAQYKRVKDAVKSIPDGNSQRCVIKVGPGVYTEKIVIPILKPYITLQGAGINKTFLHWGDTAKSSGGTAKSASVAVLSNYFIAVDIAIVNTAPAPVGGAVGEQAVAFKIQGDKAQFYRVAFYGAQDTLYDKAGRHYFKDCFIQGSIDFIFGDGQSYYDTCHLNSIAIPGSGSLTAQKRGLKSELSGFSFVNCTVTGKGPIYLGRAWGPYSRVVFLLTRIDALIIPAGWFDWGLATRRKTVFYGQYKCTGAGANTTGRVSWSYELTDKQAKPFLSTTFVDGPSWIGKL